MSRPYNKSRGRGGPQRIGGGGGGGRNAGNNNNFSHNNNSYNNNNNNNNNRNNSRRGGRVAGGGGNQRGGGRGGGGGGGGGSSSGADLMEAVLSLLFEKNVSSLDEETGMLDISAMRNCPDLSKVDRSVDFNNVGFCKCLAGVLKEKFGGRIRIVKMDNNSIKKLNPFLNALVDSGLNHGITALSAVGNDISDLSFLGPLKSFSMLSEIYLLGNSVCSTGDYSTKITRQLPNLKMLDGNIIERRMLTLPNPVKSPDTTDIGNQLLSHLQNNLIECMNEGTVENARSFYDASACLSISCYGEPIPSRTPFDHIHNSMTLQREMKNTMQADLTAVRHAIQWRNLADNVSSLSKIARNPQEVQIALKNFTGRGRQSVRSVQVANSSVNVSFIETHMKVPICVITYHANMRYKWCPIDSNSGHCVFPEGKEPFVSLFVDRTLVFTPNATGWSCTNDMIFARPDRFIVQEDNSEVLPLFFARTYDHIERMRRKLLPGGSHEVMELLVSAASSDHHLHELMQHVNNLPPDAMQSVEAVKQALDAANPADAL